MAHPFMKHKEEGAGHERAKHLTKEYKRGGRAKHGDETEDKKLFGKMIKKHDADEMKAEGKASGGRLDKFARGGRAKHKGNNTKINIVVAPKGPHPADGAAPPSPLAPPMGGGPAMPPPPGPMAAPGGPPGGPPGLPPGIGGPKPPGMMNKGGVVKRASGGRTGMKAGAETGLGRLEKARKYKARG